MGGGVVAQTCLGYKYYQLTPPVVVSVIIPHFLDAGGVPEVLQVAASLRVVARVGV